MMKRQTVWFIFHIGLLLILTLEMINVIFGLNGGLFFKAHLIFLVLLLIAAIGGVGTYAKHGNSRSLLFVYSISLLDALLLSLAARELFVLAMALPLLGIFTARKGRYKEPEEEWYTGALKEEAAKRATEERAKKESVKSGRADAEKSGKEKVEGREIKKAKKERAGRTKKAGTKNRANRKTEKK